MRPKSLFTILHVDGIKCQCSINYQICGLQGDGPGSDPEKWKELFKAAEANQLDDRAPFSQHVQKT